MAASRWTCCWRRPVGGPDEPSLVKVGVVTGGTHQIGVFFALCTRIIEDMDAEGPTFLRWLVVHAICHRHRASSPSSRPCLGPRLPRASASCTRRIRSRRSRFAALRRRPSSQVAPLAARLLGPRAFAAMALRLGGPTLPVAEVPRRRLGGSVTHCCEQCLLPGASLPAGVVRVETLPRRGGRRDVESVPVHLVAGLTNSSSQ